VQQIRLAPDKTEQFDIWIAFLHRHIRALQTSKNSPVFWPTLCICTRSLGCYIR